MTQSDEKSTSELYEQSFGISSDPLSQFAMIFACLISNCGHVGVSNATLSEEKAPVAIRFKDKSITEQNAVAIGWQMVNIGVQLYLLSLFLMLSVTYSNHFVLFRLVAYGAAISISPFMHLQDQC